MDLWNNAVGRKYGKATKTKNKLLNQLHEALKNGELIIDINDPRKYKGKSSSKIDPKKPVITILESKTGRNIFFYDRLTGIIMSRPSFVKKIQEDKYPGYTIADINSMATPMSKPDDNISNNLG